MTQSNYEFLVDFLTMVSDDQDFTVEKECNEFVITTKGEVKVNPNLLIDKKYNQEAAKQSNNDRNNILFKKAYKKQQKEFQKDLDLYNQALKKQKEEKERILKKKQETGLKLL